MNMSGKQSANRNRMIIRTSVIGIAGNLFIAVFKLIAGIAANSVSIVTDAINNISDGLSAAITIIGTRLSEKEPDREHPFGYGRIEYLSSMCIGVLILYAGFDAMRSSVLRILNPQPNHYSAITLIIVATGMVIKLMIGFHTRKKGRELSSESLIASGQDAINDSFGSAAILGAAVIYLLLGFAIEAWVGAAIALLILKTGFETIHTTSSGIIGRSADLELVAAVRSSILSFPEIEGVYDIVIHSYGKEKLYGSAHIEVSDRYTVAWVDNLQRAVRRNVRRDTGVEMLGLSICAINTRSEKAIEARETIREIVTNTEGGKEMHGFYIDLVDKTMNFDVMLEFGVRTIRSMREEVIRKVLEKYPEYDVHINITHDFTEESEPEKD